MIATNKTRQAAALSLQHLNHAVLRKALELVESGDMEQAYWAAKAAKELMDVKLSEAAPPAVIRRTESPQIEADQQIDDLLAAEYHAFDDRDALEIMAKRWVSTQAAAEFAGVDADTIRNWCRDKTIVCKLKENTKRAIWLVCPRSVGLKIINETDPRLATTTD